METSVLLLVFTIAWALVLGVTAVVVWQLRRRRQGERSREAAVLAETERVVLDAAERIRYEFRDKWDKRGW